LVLKCVLDVVFFDGCGEYYCEFELVKNKVDMEGRE